MLFSVWAKLERSSLNITYSSLNNFFTKHLEKRVADWLLTVILHSFLLRYSDIHVPFLNFTYSHVKKTPHYIAACRTTFSCSAEIHDSSSPMASHKAQGYFCIWRSSWSTQCLQGARVLWLTARSLPLHHYTCQLIQGVCADILCLDLENVILFIMAKYLHLFSLFLI